VSALNALIRETLSLPDIRESFDKRGAQPMPGSQQEMREFLFGELKKWADVVRISGARVD
jgi:tripartite-type tricarboxylate transporter receptor subunit TctC